MGQDIANQLLHIEQDEAVKDSSTTPDTSPVKPPITEEGSDMPRPIRPVIVDRADMS